jgi:hypothetical protein
MVTASHNPVEVQFLHGCGFMYFVLGFIIGQWSEVG